jgi:hypothetical protein
MDPGTLGLCSQVDLDMEVQKAAKDAPPPAVEGPRLLTPEESVTAAPQSEPVREEEREKEHELDADSVFAKLKSLKPREEE